MNTECRPTTVVGDSIVLLSRESHERPSCLLFFFRSGSMKLKLHTDFWVLRKSANTELKKIKLNAMEMCLPLQTSPNCPAPSLSQNSKEPRGISHWSRVSRDMSHIWGFGFGHGRVNRQHKPSACSGNSVKIA